jgi:hypothetical protein
LRRSGGDTIDIVRFFGIANHERRAVQRRNVQRYAIQCRDVRHRDV